MSSCRTPTRPPASWARTSRLSTSGYTPRSAAPRHAATLGDQWLLALLKAPGADWWLRAGVAQSVCRKLGIEYGEPSYYRDIYVWLPDVRWGDEAMPPCVECHSAEENANVGHRGLPIQLQRTDSDCVHTQKRTERAFAMTLHVTTRAQLCTLVPCTYAGIYARPEEICEFSPSFPPFLALFIIFPPPPFASRTWHPGHAGGFFKPPPRGFFKRTPKPLGFFKALAAASHLSQSPVARRVMPRTQGATDVVQRKRRTQIELGGQNFQFIF